ncbi:hypothetical protein ACLESO_10300 [Pyxidicoccus sp. 3LG]
MGAVLAVVCVLVELALSVALLGFALVTLGFAGEAYRHGMTPAHQALNALGILFAALPLFVTLWVSWRRFFSDRPLEGVPLGLGLPLVACVLCAGACFLSFMAGEWFTSRESEARRQRELAALRAEVEGGAREKSCDLVLLDPAATPEDMRRCRERIESLSTPEARWSELTKFLGETAGFKTWNPKQVGLAPAWDWSKSLAAVRHDQEWFVRAFYEAWLARPDALQSVEELERLRGCLRHGTRYSGWTPAAVEVLRSQVVPELSRRLDSQQDLYRNLPSAETQLQWVREELETLRTKPEEGGGPPPPKPDAVPEGTIGLARLDDDGTLRLWMRGTPSTGAFGDVYLEYHSYDEPYRKWMRYLGALAPREVRPVPSMPRD